MGKRTKAMVIVAAIMMATQTTAGAKPGPVKISYMNRVETHSSVRDSSLPAVASTMANKGYSGETYMYNSISIFRELQKGTFGSLLYLNRYSLDDNENLSHIGGATLIHMFSKRITGTAGYTYTSDPARGAATADTADKDRLSLSAIYNASAGKKHGPLFSYTTSYGTVTDWDDSSSLSQKVNVKFPNVGQKVSFDVEYTYSYGINSYLNPVTRQRDSEQLTNQYLANISYQLSKSTKLTASALFVNNVYTGALDDDSVLRFTINRSIQ